MQIFALCIVCKLNLNHTFRRWAFDLIAIFRAIKHNYLDLQCVHKAFNQFTNRGYTESASMWEGNNSKRFTEQLNLIVSLFQAKRN